MKNHMWVSKRIAFFGAVTVLLLLLHAVSEIARGETAATYGSVGVSVGGIVTFLILLLVFYLFGIEWAWKERKSGYVIVLVLSTLAFARFLFHAFTLFDSVSLEAIFAGHMSEAVGVFFLFVYLAIGLTGLTTALLCIYALAVRKQE